MSNLYQKDVDRMAADKELLDMTNQFLTDFFTKANELIGKPDDGKNDSYLFNHVLSECLVNSDFQRRKEQISYTLMDVGFVQTIIKGFFERNLYLIKLDKKIDFVLQYIDKQEDYPDWSFVKYKKVEGETTVEDIDVDVLMGKKKGKSLFNVDKPSVTHTFLAKTTKNDLKFNCTVLYVDGSLDSMVVKKATETLLTVSFQRNEIRPKVHQFKFVADINYFFNILEQVHYLLTEWKESQK